MEIWCQAGEETWCDCESVRGAAAKGPRSQLQLLASNGARVTSRVAPGQLDREISLKYRSTTRTHLKAGLQRQLHCLPDTLACTTELLPACPARGLLANCTICTFREIKIRFHPNSQRQAHGLGATIALLQSVLRPSPIPALSSSCFYGTCIAVSPLADCQNPHPIQLLPLRPLLPLAIDTPGVPTPSLLTPNQPILTSPAAGTSLYCTHLHRTDEVT